MSSFSLLAPLRSLGPGLLVAAAGIGAGDVVTATVTGARFGTTLVWALLACVVLKWVLNEGIARWQLATGSTVIDACMTRLPVWVRGYFLAYLLLWAFFVGGSLTNASGLAAHSMFPQWPVWAWAVLHSGVAATLVLVGRFGFLDKLMKALVAIMVITVLICAVLLKPDVWQLLRDMTHPTLPPQSGRAILGIFGGIGGSMTMLCYGYWIRENAWSGANYQRAVRADLLLAYGVTFIFAVALTIVAAGCDAAVTSGSGMALEVAAQLEHAIGPAGRWVFLVGFWCAVFTAMLAVWQGVPYLFADIAVRRGPGGTTGERDLRHTPAYRGFLLYLAGPPLLLLFADEPVAMVVLFTVIGAFFMPFLAALLLYLNNRGDWTGALRNGAASNLALIFSLLLFGWIALSEILVLAK
jgi:Mn2+/Fe2+ NRAMP family transporter